MAKIQIKSEKLTPFGGLFSIMEQFDSTLSSVIDSTLSLKCVYFVFFRVIVAMTFTIMKKISVSNTPSIKKSREE